MWAVSLCVLVCWNKLVLPKSQENLDVHEASSPSAVALANGRIRAALALANGDHAVAALALANGDHAVAGMGLANGDHAVAGMANGDHADAVAKGCSTVTDDSVAEAHGSNA